MNAESAENALRRRSRRWDRIAVVALLGGSGISIILCIVGIVATFVNISFVPMATLALMTFAACGTGYGVYVVATAVSDNCARQAFEVRYPPNGHDYSVEGLH